jgi:hypothetical protein
MNLDKKSFNLKDLINIENIPKDILESIKNNEIIDLEIKTDEEVSNEQNKEVQILDEKERLHNIELVKNRLITRQQELSNKRKGKNVKEDMKIKMLKENPLLKNLGNLDSLNSPEAKKIIDNMASKMCNNSKQKKAIKKQMEKLIGKMDTTSI